MLVLLTTVPDKSHAETLASKIVEARLAACVQILPPMTSVYVWEGEVQCETEHLLLIKTLPERYVDLEKFIAENHSYDVPEIVALKPEYVSESYAKWLGEVLQ